MNWPWIVIRHELLCDAISIWCFKRNVSECELLWKCLKVEFKADYKVRFSSKSLSSVCFTLDFYHEIQVVLYNFIPFKSDIIYELVISLKLHLTVSCIVIFQVDSKFLISRLNILLGLIFDRNTKTLKLFQPFSMAWNDSKWFIETLKMILISSRDSQTEGPRRPEIVQH